ncbi:MAG: quinoprotein relay system zinc metallohydrolase 2 [Gammaproteobacteria bacterium]|nr:quinoprotein relay system zinc metallohydrolase 2 [Gammaproteobacteria bacterium]
MPVKANFLLFSPRTLALALLIFFLGTSDETFAECAVSAKVEEIQPGLFVRHGKYGAVFEQSNLANVGFIVGDSCIAVIDSGGSPDEGEALRCAIRDVSPLPICYVINTHVHPDHTLGNQAFEQEQPEFVGHSKIARAFLLLGDTYIERARIASPNDTRQSGLHVVKPGTLIENTVELELGNRPLRIQPVSQSHTDNDLTVLDIKTGTLWTGDLVFAEHVPVIGGSGSINGWIDSLDRIADDGVKRIVPGHGPVSGMWRDVIDLQRQYLLLLRSELRDWIVDGGDIGPAVEKLVQSERDKWQMFDHFHKRNVSYAYTELEWE